MNLPRKLRVFAAFAFLSTALTGVAAGAPMIIHVKDVTGAPVADAVVLVTRGSQSESSALLTDRTGSAVLPTSEPQQCVVTAIDPRHMFFNRTTEAVCGATPSVTLTLPIRPIIDKFGDPTAMTVTIQVIGPGGRPLRHAQLMLRRRTGNMKDNSFVTLTSGRTGFVKAELPPGKYVLATRTTSGFLEEQFEVGAAARRECSEQATKCLVSAAKHVVSKKPVVVTLRTPANKQ